MSSASLGLPIEGSPDGARLPGPPPFSLLTQIVNQLKFVRDPIGYMRGLHEAYGRLVSFEKPPSTRYVFAFGPEYNAVLHKEPERFHSRGLAIWGAENTPQRRLATSLFALNGEQHRRFREVLLPPFQKSSLAGYHADLVTVLQKQLHAWQPGQLRDIAEDMRQLSWCVARKMLYGLDDSGLSESLRRGTENWLDLNNSVLVHAFPFNLPFAPYRRLLRQADHLEQAFLAMMRARVAEGCQNHDVLSILLWARTAEGQAVSHGDLVGHVMTLFLAAYETTANTLTWTLFLLAQHPQAQNDLLDELACLGGEPPTLDQLDRLPLLNRVMKESMRLLPAIVFSRRVAAADGMLGRYFLPQGSRVVFSHYLTHHLPDVYAEPERFLPERWETITPSPAEYLPFGTGHRMCIGAAMAQFIVKTALATIVPRWRLTVAPQARIDRHVAISLGPKRMPMTLAYQDRQFQTQQVRGNIHEMVDLSATARRAVVGRAASFPASA